MKKLPAAMETRRSEILSRLRSSSEDLESAIERFNELVEEAWTDVADAIESYNVVIDDAEELRDETSEAIRDYMDERSGKWTEGHRGQSYETWAGAIEDLSFDRVEIDKLDLIDTPETGAADELEQNWVSEPDCA